MDKLKYVHTLNELIDKIIQLDADVEALKTEIEELKRINNTN